MTIVALIRHVAFICAVLEGCGILSVEWRQQQEETNVMLNEVLQEQIDQLEVPMSNSVSAASKSSIKSTNVDEVVSTLIRSSFLQIQDVKSMEALLEQYFGLETLPATELLEETIQKRLTRFMEMYEMALEDMKRSQP